MVETTGTIGEPTADASEFSEYKYCPECEEEVAPVWDGELGAMYCPDCQSETIYKPLYLFEVTRHVWKYCTVLAGSAEEAKDMAEEDGDWEESPDYDETAGEANLGGGTLR